MKTQILIATLAILLVTEVVIALPYSDQEEAGADEYNDNLERLIENTQKAKVTKRSHYMQRRSCLRRGERCDNRINDCCYNSSCRCNLWGNNCYCERMGLFQQWGK